MKTPAGYPCPSLLVLLKKREMMILQEIGRAVPVYAIVGGRLLRGKGVPFFLSL